jgi:hypothetical protein
MRPFIATVGGRERFRNNTGPSKCGRHSASTLAKKISERLLVLCK